MRGKYNRLPTGPGASLQGFRRGTLKADGGITDTLRGQAQVFNGEDGKPPNPNGKNRQSPVPQTTCHCESKVLPTTWERIRQGAGESCGPNCQPTPTEESQP